MKTCNKCGGAVLPLGVAMGYAGPVCLCPDPVPSYPSVASGTGRPYPTVYGTARTEHPCVLEVSFSRKPTDEELRAFDEFIKGR